MILNIVHPEPSFFAEVTYVYREGQIDIIMRLTLYRKSLFTIFFTAFNHHLHSFRWTATLAEHAVSGIMLTYFSKGHGAVFEHDIERDSSPFMAVPA